MGRRIYLKLFLTATIFIFSLFNVNCQRAKGDLTVVGSTSVQPFAEMLADEYMIHHGKEKIYIQGGGSTAGVQAVFTGAAQVGMSSRNLTPTEQGLIAIPIAYDAIVVIVHPGNPLSKLSIAEIQKIFSGEVKYWRELGGRNERITLVTREEGSGTREAFQHLLMGKKEISLAALVQDSNGAIRQVVADDPNAIGYISMGLINSRVKALQIDEVEPNIENIKLKRYKIIRPFLFIFPQEPKEMSKRFLDYILSPEGQKLLTQEGLVSVSLISEGPKGGGG